jgi:malate dehydrogenase (oxaloacetate-decarboxylating)(NADP+)
MQGADVFVGVSAKGVVTPAMVAGMARDPIVMAMANPDPEISYPEAKAVREDVIMCTGRSDYPNQVNNVLGFPFIFRGALDVRATCVNEAMKIAAVQALAQLAREEVPEEVRRAYDGAALSFGREYVIPKPFDYRALLRVAPAVARAAMESDVARIPITDWKAYTERLERLLGREREVMRKVINKAARHPRRVVLPEGDNPKVLRAAQLALEEGIAKPILLGTDADIRRVAEANDIPLDGLEIVDHLNDPRFDRYVEAFWRQRHRRGVTEVEARRLMVHRNYFGSMMVRVGDADGLVTGMERSYPESIRPALQCVGVRRNVKVASGAYIVILPDRIKFFADTTVNVDPNAEALAEIAISTARLARSLEVEPVVAMLSFSNFGSARFPQSDKVAAAVELIRQAEPDLPVDGEMQVGAALDVDHRKRLFPFSTLEHEANVLVFPTLDAGNIAYKLMGHLGGAELVGPILSGMNKPVNILERDCAVRTVVNIIAITVLQSVEGAP